jgi:hypothetical protein
MAIVNIFKARLPANVVPLVAVAIAVALNIGSAFLFGTDPLAAFKDAFVGAGIVVGLFASNDTQSGRAAAATVNPEISGPEVTD